MTLSIAGTGLVGTWIWWVAILMLPPTHINLNMKLKGTYKEPVEGNFEDTNGAILEWCGGHQESSDDDLRVLLFMGIKFSVFWCFSLK